MGITINLRGSLERRVECEHDYDYDGYYFTCRACGQRIGAN